MIPPQQYDLALAYDWEYDRDFIDLLDSEATGMGMRVLQIGTAELPAVLGWLNDAEFGVRTMIDRASDTSPQFLDLQSGLQKRGTRIIDPLEALHWASDKATMHLEFIEQGLHTPYTQILPPFSQEPDFPLDDRQILPLGLPFVIKPANTTGGGQGVILTALTLDEVIQARRQYPHDKYLLQERVHAKSEGLNLFWFRAFFVAGWITFCWWNPDTHIYRMLLPHAVKPETFASLLTIMEQISRICRLTFFSSEIIINQSDQPVIVDYVNEICDMRLQSRHRDGVPDELVMAICKQLAGYCCKIDRGADPGQKPPFDNLADSDRNSG